LVGLCFQACAAVWERFGMGVLQTGGALGHQNLLGLVSHFVVFPWFALLLAGERGWRPILGPLAGLIVDILTVSRATIGLAAAGYGGLFVLSALRRWTPHKASFEQRFRTDSTSNYDERAAFEKAAALMLSDHPLGVGANYYVVAANTGGYNYRAGVAAVIGSESANVHNIYYLVAAETGYIGLVTLVLMLFQPLLVAFRCGWRNRGDRRGDLLLGFGTSLFIVYIHSYFEWTLVTFTPQYIFALDTGMVAGIATQLGYWRAPKRATASLSLERWHP